MIAKASPLVPGSTGFPDEPDAVERGHLGVRDGLVLDDGALVHVVVFVVVDTDTDAVVRSTTFEHSDFFRFR